jgi:hypothetical protein
MLKPHQQNPIPNEALKRFLLHEEPLVRDLVTYYFHESWSLDEGLIPLVLEAYRRFGEEAAHFSLGHARRFPLNTSSLLESALALERSQPPCVEDWLARAPLPLVESHENLLRSVLSFSARARVERRRSLQKMSTTELWQRLSLLASDFDTPRFELEHWEQVEDLIEALTTKETRQAVVEKFQELERNKSFLLQWALIGLAGSMNLYEVSRPLVELLGHDDDALAEAASAAIGRLGSPSCLSLLDARYRKGSFGFRLYAIGALQAMKLPSSETLLRGLVDEEDDPALRGRIFDALRFHFTEAAGAMMQSELREPTSFMLPDELEKALFVHARILQRKNDEADGLRQENPDWDSGLLFEIPVMEQLQSHEPCPCGRGKSLGDSGAGPFDGPFYNDSRS